MQLIRRSSSLGRAVFHIGFKTKYCKEIFRYTAVKEYCIEIFFNVAERYKIRIIEIGFDLEHVHMIADIGLYSIPQVAKWFKGTSGKLLLKQFPWLKKKYFWGSGVWSGVVYFDSINVEGKTFGHMSSYVRSQGKKHHRTLGSFL